MSLMNVIKRLLGRAEYIEVIADKTCNANIPDGYAGGSLSNDNVLIITNTELPAEVVKDVFSKEKTYYSVKSVKHLLHVEDIIDAGKDLIGPFTHIINIFYDKDEMSLISKNGQFNDKDSMYQFYQWHQEEVDYLVKLNQYATICSVFISGSSIEESVKKKNAEMCIRGLAESLSNHRMICNGIIAGKDVILKAIFDTTVFLSSRYGQIMTGEVLKIE